MRPDPTLVLSLVAMTVLAPALRSPTSGPSPRPTASLCSPCDRTGEPEPRLDYSVSCAGVPVLQPSPLGIVRRDAAPFDECLTLEAAGPSSPTKSPTPSSTANAARCARSVQRSDDHVSQCDGCSVPGPAPPLRRRGRLPLPLPRATARNHGRCRASGQASRLPEGSRVWAHAVRRAQRLQAGLRGLLGERHRRGHAVAHAGRLGLPLALPYPGRPMGSDHRGGPRRHLLRQPPGRRRPGRALPAEVPRARRGQRHGLRPAVGAAPLGDPLARHRRRHVAGLRGRVDARGEPEPPLGRRRHELDQARPGVVELALRPQEPRKTSPSCCRSSTLPRRWAGSTRWSTPTGTS